MHCKTPIKTKRKSPRNLTLYNVIFKRAKKNSEKGGRRNTEIALYGITKLKSPFPVESAQPQEKAHDRIEVGGGGGGVASRHRV